MTACRPRRRRLRPASPGAIRPAAAVPRHSWAPRDPRAAGSRRSLGRRGPESTLARRRGAAVPRSAWQEAAGREGREREQAEARSHVARRGGVGRGMRRRDAQSRCPGLVVHQHDPDRDARLFEPVAAAIEQHAVGVEVVLPASPPSPPPARPATSAAKNPLAELLLDEVSATSGVECQVGITEQFDHPLERDEEPAQRSGSFTALSSQNDSLRSCTRMDAARVRVDPYRRSRRRCRRYRSVHAWAGGGVV